MILILNAMTKGSHAIRAKIEEINAKGLMHLQRKKLINGF